MARILQILLARKAGRETEILSRPSPGGNHENQRKLNDSRQNIQ